ncbi:MAG: DEAD/DEAH box helicase [Omnitrophica WOR_2 bacterium]
MKAELDYLQRLDIQELKPMQVEAIEAISKGSEVILISPTGSGKTVAFLLPILRLLDENKPGIQALILTPSRELALQIEKVFKTMQTGFKVNTCYGGHPISTELNNLSVAPALLIGTPGRVADHIRRESFKTDSVQSLVLDEFDKSLELGFKDEMEFITQSLTRVVTKVLTSATSMSEIPAFVKLKHPVTIDYNSDEENIRLTVKVVRSEGTDKLEMLYRLICDLKETASVIFCNHREAVNRISELLNDKGITHGIYHGGMEQEKRELALIRFRNGTHHLLLTTDLASRGLDIPEIRNVIHYQLPGSLNIWTHRNGRTARMEKQGVAWLILAMDDYVPPFITESFEEIKINDCNQPPQPTPWETVYISAGKKDKISKGDIVGFLTQKGLLEKDDIGLIEVLDYAAFVAVKSKAVTGMLKQVKGEQLKKKKVKIEIAV